jgi:hypothetical protein
MIAAMMLSATLLQNAETNLVAKYGEAQRPRIHRGLKQVAQFWRGEDGDDTAFQSFVMENFAGDATTLDALFNRMQFAFESLDGHLAEISRDWKWQSDLDLGTVYPFDETMAGYDPSAHITDDLYQNKLAFVPLIGDGASVLWIRSKTPRPVERPPLNAPEFTIPRRFSGTSAFS